MQKTSYKKTPDSIDIDNLDLSAMSESQRREFKILLAEAKNRGLQLPLEKIDRTRVKFPRTSEGYFYKADGKPYIPTGDGQLGFLASSSRFGLFYGPRGCGKTATGSQKALDRISQGQNGVIINPVFEDFKNSTWAEFRQWIPPETVVFKHRYRLREDYEPSKPFRIVFTNGAVVLCKGLKNPNSARGPNVNWLWYDEGGSDPDGEGWRIAIASVRVGHEPQAWVTSTPNGILHWMFDFFESEEKSDLIEKILEEFGEDLGDRPIVESFYGTMEENKHNLDAGFYATMQTAYSGWQKEQEIEGHFVSQGGALGDSSWFDGRKLDRIPDDVIIKNRVRYWDLAASEKKLTGKKKGSDPDKTVGTLFSWADRNGNSWMDENNTLVTLEQLPHYKGKDVYFIEDQVSGYWKWKSIKDKVWDTALRDGHFIKVRIEQEPGSGGINQVEEMKLFFQQKCKELGIPEFDIEGHNPRNDGDKVIRANTWFSDARNGYIYLIDGIWITNFFRILNVFPTGKHDDEVDSVSGARLTCAPIFTWRQIDFRHL